MAVEAELVDEAELLGRHRGAWDALAVAAGRPYCAPGWMLSWWHASAPAGAGLAVCVVREDEELLGVAAFFVMCDGEARYALLGEGSASPIGPLARAGREADVARAVGLALGAAHPPAQRIVFAGVLAASPWPHLIAGGWPDAERPQVVRAGCERLPCVTIAHGDLEQWLATRSANFRQRVRRARRRLAEAGARFRLSAPDELDRDLDALARLHHSRWARRGGSRALDARVESMLRLAGAELIGEGRFRLWSIDVDGETISAHLFVAAGGVQAYWLGGFDDRWAAFQPSIQVLVAAIEDGIARGEHRVELGPGAQPYKYRLADTDEELEALHLAWG